MAEMQHTDEQKSDSSSAVVAYLIVREGSTWRDVFRLTPGQVTTIGRAPTNRIVLRDEICSRNHCEVFQSGSQWTLRDLGSRNGTLLDGIHVAGDSELTDGQLIQIGACELGFTRDISQPFPQFQEHAGPDDDTETAVDLVFDHPDTGSQPSIIHRTRKNRYQSPGVSEPLTRDRTSRELADLYRLALEMGAAADAGELAEVVLNGLFSGTCTDIGAILLLPESTMADPDPHELGVIAYKGEGDLPYQKLSDHLAGMVLREREAVLGRDVSDDSRLASRDSLGRIHAQSVICAPIRAGEVVYGLIHLYSTNPDKPLDPDALEFTLAVADQLAVALDNLKEKEILAAGLAQARNENRTLRRQLEIESELVGESESMQKLREEIGRIAPTDATTLIRGESGVGKELVARAIHFSSQRRDRPFVCMNCAALNESLLESELFGHEKGAFTGAGDRKIGRFEQAHTGTLFLDEVGEMNPAIQAKFLRVLEGHPFERIGGRTPIEVDVRVVAATNRDLEQAVGEGLFRKDLYFRLRVVEVTVEPLREHRADIPQLVNFFLERLALKTGRPLKRLTPAARKALAAHDWPGNVRELQNAVERAVILSPEELIDEMDVQLSALGGQLPDHPETKATTGYREVSLDVLEQEHILDTLERTNWNKSKAAAILGIERSTLDRKLKRYRVSRPKA